MLSALGFPQIFIGWISECVTSPSFTLAINGSSFGFFQGRRGLRQGDPLSPMLFTICMEYLSRILGAVGDLDAFRFHPLCKSLKLNHLMFADDLLLFCKGDIQSIMLLLRAFSSFSVASGLSLNREKSDIYFNGMKTSDMNDIMMVSGFRKGIFPFRYLGVPISTKKLSVMDGRMLIDKVTARIRSWGASHLSYSGRLVLTQSVLTTLHSYWMTVFLLPSGIIKKIESICRNYLWYGIDSYHHAPNVSWDDCCYPKEVGGLGLRSSKDWNKALLGKYIWWIEKKQDHLWVKWINHVYLKGVHWTEYVPPLDCAWSWRKIAHCMVTFKSGTSAPTSVNKFSVMEAYLWLREVKNKVPWRFVCWNTLNIPRCSFIFWEYKLGRLFTYDRIKKMGYTGDDKCLFCKLDLETHKHLFHDCVFAQHCWSELQRCLGLKFWPDRIETWCCRGAKVSKLVRNIVSACVVAVIYSIWLLRNKVRVENVVVHPKWVITKTIADVITRFRARNKSMLSLYDRTWLSKL